MLYCEYNFGSCNFEILLVLIVFKLKKMSQHFWNLGFIVIIFFVKIVKSQC